MNYHYQTGRKELFQGAPERAMVVLEHKDDERLFFAVAHEMGAHYWEADGSPGARTGLIALVRKTRVVATRMVKRGEMDVSAFQALEQDLSEASRPQAKKLPPATTTVKAKPVTEMTLGRSVPATPTRPAVQPAVKPVAASGFVSMFKIVANRDRDQPFITINANGNINVSGMVAVPGDFVDLQIDPIGKVIRVGTVSTGGKKLNKTRHFACRGITQMFNIPEGKASLRINLTRGADGWFLGAADVTLPEGFR